MKNGSGGWAPGRCRVEAAEDVLGFQQNTDSVRNIAITGDSSILDELYPGPGRSSSGFLNWGMPLQRPGYYGLRDKREIEPPRAAPHLCTVLYKLPPSALSPPLAVDGKKKCKMYDDYTNCGTINLVGITSQTNSVSDRVPSSGFLGFQEEHDASVVSNTLRAVDGILLVRDLMSPPSHSLSGTLALETFLRQSLLQRVVPTLYFGMDSTRLFVEPAVRSAQERSSTGSTTSGGLLKCYVASREIEKFLENLQEELIKVDKVEETFLDPDMGLPLSTSAEADTRDWSYDETQEAKLKESEGPGKKNFKARRVGFLEGSVVIGDPAGDWAFTFDDVKQHVHNTAGTTGSAPATCSSSSSSAATAKWRESLVSFLNTIALLSSRISHYLTSLEDDEEKQKSAKEESNHLLSLSGEEKRSAATAAGASSSSSGVVDALIALKPTISTAILEEQLGQAVRYSRNISKRKRDSSSSRGGSSGDTTVVEKEISSSTNTDPLLLLTMLNYLMHFLFPASDAVLGMIYHKLPSPKVAQKYRAELLVTDGENSDHRAQCSESASLGLIQGCDPTSPLIGYIFKMVTLASSDGREETYGLCRLFSGEILGRESDADRQQKVNIMGPHFNLQKRLRSSNTDPSTLDDFFGQRPIQSVPVVGFDIHTSGTVETPIRAGSITLVRGLDNYLLSSGTICDVGESFLASPPLFPTGGAAAATNPAESSTTVPSFFSFLAPICTSKSLCATVTSTSSGNSRRNRRHHPHTSGLVKVHVSSKIPTDLPRLVENLKSMARKRPELLVDAHGESNGAHVISGPSWNSVRLGLDILLEEHEARGLNRGGVAIGEHIVSLRETVTMVGAEGMARSSNMHNRISAYGQPVALSLCEEIDNEYEENIFSRNGLAKGKENCLIEQHGWSKEEVGGIWTFGELVAGGSIPGGRAADGCWPTSNVLLNMTNRQSSALSVHPQQEQLATPDGKLIVPPPIPRNRPAAAATSCMMDEIKDSVCAGWNWSISEGPICDQPVRGFRADLTYAELHSDAIHRGGGQVIPAARRCFIGAFLRCQPRLLEPVFQMDIICMKNSLRTISRLILEGKRRSMILKEKVLRQDGEIFSVVAAVPVMEAPQLEEEMMRAVGPSSFWIESREFLQWKTLPGDPLQEEEQSSSSSPSSSPPPDAGEEPTRTATTTTTTTAGFGRTFISAKSSNMAVAARRKITRILGTDSLMITRNPLRAQTYLDGMNYFPPPNGNCSSAPSSDHTFSHWSLLPYDVSLLPDGQPPFHHDLLERIFLFLPLDFSGVLLPVSAVSQSWRFLANQLPHWSFIQYKNRTRRIVKTPTMMKAIMEKKDSTSNDKCYIPQDQFYPGATRNSFLVVK